MPLRSGRRRELRTQLRERQANSLPPSPDNVAEGDATNSASAPLRRRSRNVKGRRGSASDDASMGDDPTVGGASIGSEPRASSPITIGASPSCTGAAGPAAASAPRARDACRGVKPASEDAELLVIGSAAHRRLVRASLLAARATGGAAGSGGAADGMGERVQTTDSNSGASPEPARQGNRFQVIEGGAGGAVSEHGRQVAAAAAEAAACETQAAAVARRKASGTRQLFEHLLVLDFEATCDSDNGGFDHEIIEFPITVVHTPTRRVVAEFHSFVRPVKNPTLTPFCTELTGITQEQVDAAPTLPEVLINVRAWLRGVFPAHAAASVAASVGFVGAPGGEPVNPCPHPSSRHNKDNAAGKDGEGGNAGALGCRNSSINDASNTSNCDGDGDGRDCAFSDYLLQNHIACFCTDGPWDMRKFMLESSVLRDGVVFPKLFYSYINLRKAYANFFRTKPLTLTQMLIRQGLQFQGNLHSGRDDTRNIARIALLLMERGCVLKHVSTLPLPDDEGVRAAQQMEALLREFEEEDKRLKTKLARRQQPQQQQQQQQQPQHATAKKRRANKRAS